MFSLQCVLQLCFELQLWLHLPKLRSDFRRKFPWFERRGHDVVSAQIQGAGALQRSTVNNHHNLGSLGISTCFYLADQVAAAEVRWRYLRDQNFRGES